MEVFLTKSVRGTEAFGREFAARLRAGDCVALIGPLGAGKTALVRGIAAGLGVADRRAVSSPTYVLVQEYAGRIPVYHVDLYRLGAPTAGEGRSGKSACPTPSLHRIGTDTAQGVGQADLPDLRLRPASPAVAPAGPSVGPGEAALPDAAAELAALGLDEMLASGVVLIEWADRAAGALPRPRWQIEIEPAGERRRRFLLTRTE